MSQSCSSPSLPPPDSEPNAQVADVQSVSSRFSRQTSEKESSLAKNRPLARKPDSNSGLETYKTIKRKSQENGNPFDATPPKYPRSSQQIKLPSESQEGSQRGSLRGENEDTVKFKKKPLTREEIVDIKDYVEGLEKSESEVNSVAGTERPTAHRDMAGPTAKELNKKSKTEYFHIEDFQRYSPTEAAQSQGPGALSEADRVFIASLKQKCKSVDENNSLLQKRISWLREEVEMHLERQLSFDCMKQHLERAVQLKDDQLQAERKAHAMERQDLLKQVKERDGEIQRLKGLFIDLHNKFEDERETLVQEVEFLRAEKESDIEERQHLEERIKDLELTVSALMQEKKQIEINAIPQQYSKPFLEKLVEESKYLKVENHILAKCKDEVQRLQKQLKRVANERDGLKKKIIESAKRDRMRHSNLDDSSDSSFFALSEISFSEASFKRS